MNRTSEEIMLSPSKSVMYSYHMRFTGTFSEFQKGPHSVFV